MGTDYTRVAVHNVVLDEYLRRQDGVVTLADAKRCGLSQDAIDRRVRSGRWRRCARGVYFATDREFTPSAQLRAEVWGYGEGAVASGLAAAWWFGVTRFPPEINEVTVAGTARLRHQPGTRLRRRDLKPADIAIRRDLRVTALPLTVLEAAVRKRGGATLLDSALQRHTELRPLWAAHLRNKGRHGSPAARRLLQAADNGARSVAERLLIKLLKSAGITGWKANYPVAGYRVDVGFLIPRVAIEVDGFAFHSDSDDFHTDRVRQNAIALAGWQVLRFTWLDLTEYPQRVLAEISFATGQR